MSDDFPAAHSMDTIWFAVDGVGHVALFSTGEDGHAPPNTRQDDGMELMNVLEGKEDDPDEEWEDRATRLGLFYYRHSHWTFALAGPYEREREPKQPVHVDQLPPALRERARQRCLKKMNFAHQELIQPLEQYACEFWNEPVAYLCGDGKTVRPYPGNEEAFADFRKEFCELNPEVARHLVFEAPEENR
jgi:hypothetical protein